MVMPAQVLSKRSDLNTMLTQIETKKRTDKIFRNKIPRRRCRWADRGDQNERKKGYRWCENDESGW
jgi:hypothetical protein